MGEMINIQSTEGEVEAYLSKPNETAKGAIIVIHEVWGLVDHIKEVADRYAREGYIALAPNLLKVIDFGSKDVTQLQKDLFDPETRSQAQPEIRRLTAPMQSPEFAGVTINHLKACFDYLYNLDGCNQKVAITGFCFGGSYSFSLATEEPNLKIALPFYGHADQPVEVLSKITCPVRAFFGKNDAGLIDKLPELAERMANAGVDYSAKVYDTCGHAFFNDTNNFTYNKDAANDAWAVCLNELNKVMS